MGVMQSSPIPTAPADNTLALAQVLLPHPAYLSADVAGGIQVKGMPFIPDFRCLFDISYIWHIRSVSWRLVFPELGRFLQRHSINAARIGAGYDIGN